jgi:hypothetical protein
MNMSKTILCTFRLLTIAALVCIPGALARAADVFGYTATNSTMFSYLNVSGTGSSALSGIDDGTVNLSLPFGFRFYGATYTSLCVSSNGLITFGGCPSDDMTTRDLTAQPTPGNAPVIAPFWMDLTFAVPGAGSVCYQTLGSVGSRQFVVQWNNVHALNGSDALNFEAVLNEGSNTILFQYSKVDSADAGVNQGTGATVGIAGANAVSNGYSLQWSRNTAVITDNEAILFTPPAPATPVDVSSSVSITSSAFVYSRLTQTYSGTVTVTNSSAASITLPLTVVLTNLTAGVTAVNATGVLKGQGPYYLLPGSGTALAPKQAITFSVSFSDLTNVKIGFVAKTYSGSF